MLDLFLFAGFPYIAIALAIVVGVYRYFGDRFSYSSLSTQFLENDKLFWGSVAWHYGIILILLAHVFAFLLPDLHLAIVGGPLRTVVLEVTGWALAMYSLFGLILLAIRRLSVSRVAVTSNLADWLLLLSLIVQVALGLYIAVFYTWGGLWFTKTAASWLWSLVTLRPDISYVQTMPWAVKLHFFLAFVVILLFPFTRLVHVFTLPVTYLWRPYQVVVWMRKSVRGV